MNQRNWTLLSSASDFEYFSHSEKLRLALEELTNAKNKEKENAVKGVQQEMQILVDTAYAARDDYLALYTKVLIFSLPL